jgi:phosphatidylserine/phosphatidylglycerophosphate/cardiolipin synthase-like enzyme
MLNISGLGMPKIAKNLILVGLLLCLVLVSTGSRASQVEEPSQHRARLSTLNAPFISTAATAMGYIWLKGLVVRKLALSQLREANLLLAGGAPSEDLLLAIDNMRVLVPTLAEKSDAEVAKAMVLEALDKTTSAIALLDRPSEQVQAKLDLINSAKMGDELLISSFIFGTRGGEDEIQWWITHALRNAGRRGVNVHLLIDGAGWRASAAVMKLLLDARVKIHIFEFDVWGALKDVAISPARLFTLDLDILSRMHDKLMILNRQEMIAGSSNIVRGFRIYDRLNAPHERDIYYLGAKVPEAAQHFFEIVNHRRTRTFFLRQDGSIGWRRSSLTPLNTASPISEKPQAGDEELLLEVEKEGRAVTDKKMRAALAQYKKFLLAFPPHLPSESGLPEPVLRSLSRAWMQNVVKVQDRSIELVFDDLNQLGQVSRNSSVVARIIGEAQDGGEVLIENPYILLSQTIRVAIDRALARGVRFTLYTNSRRTNDEALTHGGYQQFFAEIARRGIRVFEICPRPQYPLDHVCTNFRTNTHSKNLVVDGRIAHIGSYNMDPRSERLNSESSMVIYDAEVAQRLRGMILKHHRFGAEEIKGDKGYINGIDKPFSGETFTEKLADWARQKFSILIYPQL